MRTLSFLCRDAMLTPGYVAVALTLQSVVLWGMADLDGSVGRRVLLAWNGLSVWLLFHGAIALFRQRRRYARQRRALEDNHARFQEAVASDDLATASTLFEQFKLLCAAYEPSEASDYHCSECGRIWVTLEFSELPQGVRFTCKSAHSWNLPGKTMEEVVRDFPALAPQYRRVVEKEIHASGSGLSPWDPGPEGEMGSRTGSGP